MLGDSLRRIKDEKHLTVAQLSRSSGLAADTINKIMSGVTQYPSPDTVSRLADALGCSVSDLTGEEQQFPNLCRACPERGRIEDLHQSIRRLQTRLQQDRREKIFLAIVMIAIIAFIASMIVIDFYDPNVGWHRT